MEDHTKETLTEYRNVLLVGDVIDQLRRLPDGIVQCVVTSPPYWGLRDYGTATWEGGDPNCDHKGKPMATKANINRNTGTGTDKKTQKRVSFTRRCVENAERCGSISNWGWNRRCRNMWKK